MAEEGSRPVLKEPAEIPEEYEWAMPYVYGGAVLGSLLLVPILSKCKRTWKNPIYQAFFLACVIISIVFVPGFIQDVFFSEFGVLVIGTLLPIYESIVAVCTVGEDDDTAWLQFWITNATFTYMTEFMDSITHLLPNAGEHWYEFEFFFTLWLVLPFTDGAAFIYDNFTEPYISPITKKMTKVFEGWIGLLMTVVNSSYLYLVWFVFLSLPEEARRFVVVAVGTVYPIAASTVAVTTKETGLDDTYWLTYWACFSILFILMDYLENFVGHIRGFYSICLVATIYLFLPMFEGAKSVFRNILVPLSGQYENMLLHDTYLVKLDMEKKIPEKLRPQVMSKAAGVFTKNKNE